MRAQCHPAFVAGPTFTRICRTRAGRSVLLALVERPRCGHGVAWGSCLSVHRGRWLHRAVGRIPADIAPSEACGGKCAIPVSRDSRICLRASHLVGATSTRYFFSLRPLLRAAMSRRLARDHPGLGCQTGLAEGGR